MLFINGTKNIFFSQPSGLPRAHCTLENTNQLSCSEQGQVEQVTQGCVQPNFVYRQRWKLHRLLVNKGRFKHISLYFEVGKERESLLGCLDQYKRTTEFIWNFLLHSHICVWFWVMWTWEWGFNVTSSLIETVSVNYDIHCCLDNCINLGLVIIKLLLIWSRFSDVFDK